MTIKNYLCPGYRKRLKLIYGLIKHINIHISYQVFSIYMQSKQDVLILVETKNTLKNFEPYKKKKSILEKQDIKKNHRNLRNKSLNTKIHAKNNLLRYNSQIKLLRMELSSSLKEVRFSNQEFSTGTPISNIKYNYLGFQNNNLFYLLYD